MWLGRELQTPDKSHQPLKCRAHASALRSRAALDPTPSSVRIPLSSALPRLVCGVRRAPRWLDHGLSYQGREDSAVRRAPRYWLRSCEAQGVRLGEASGCWTVGPTPWFWWCCARPASSVTAPKVNTSRVLRQCQQPPLSAYQETDDLCPSIHGKCPQTHPEWTGSGKPWVVHRGPVKWNVLVGLSPPSHHPWSWRSPGRMVLSSPSESPLRGRPLS